MTTARKQREGLRNVINYLRPAVYMLADARLTLSQDEMTRLIQTLERHLKELPRS